MSNERAFVRKCIRYTGFEADTISNGSIRRIIAEFGFTEAEVNATVNEKAEVAGFNERVACIRVEFHQIEACFMLMLVIPTDNCSDRPSIIEIITNFRKDIDVGQFTRTITPCADRTTYINLCGYTECHNSHNGHN